LTGATICRILATHVFIKIIETSDQQESPGDEIVMASNATQIQGAAIQDSMDVYTDSLGQVLGDIVIVVDLRRDECLWCTAGSLLQGYLPFQIGFMQNGRKLHLMSTCVDITLKDHDGNDRVVVGKTFPLQTLVSRQNLKQEKVITNELHVEPEVEAMGNSAKIGGGSHTSEKKSAVEEMWYFQSAKLADQKAQFRWGRNSVTDESGVVRTYVGALLLQRGQHRDTDLEVVVSIIAKKSARLHFRGEQELEGGPVTTTVGSWSEQCSLPELGHQRLNDKVRRLNAERVPRSKATRSRRHTR
jgi:hypothetical protein